MITYNKIPRSFIPFLQGLDDSRFVWLKCYEDFTLICLLFLMHCGECRQVGITGKFQRLQALRPWPLFSVQPSVLEKMLQGLVSHASGATSPGHCSTVTAHWVVISGLV